MTPFSGPARRPVYSARSRWRPSIDPRVACSSITFRHRPLPEALSLIHAQGFRTIDLGALPGVCDHVPETLDADAVTNVARVLAEHELAVASINADIGDMNRRLDARSRAGRDEHLMWLAELCHAVRAPALVLPNGSQGTAPLESEDIDLDRSAEALRHAAERIRTAGLRLWVEAQHSGRLCNDLARASALVRRLSGSGIGVVLDFSHVVAAGDDPLRAIDALGPQVEHVHLRDAVRGDIHRSLGRGYVDFAAGVGALESAGYAGLYSLELETADVSESERPAAARRAGEFVGRLLARTRPEALTS